MKINNIKNFLKTDAGAGVLLGMMALLAIIIANTPLKIFYNYLLSTPLVIQIGALEINKPLLLWINDGLMAVFFLLIGLEIKREILEGQLSTKEQISLPLVAAVGGLLFPALIYYYFNADNEIYLKGWAFRPLLILPLQLGLWHYWVKMFLKH